MFQFPGFASEIISDAGIAPGGLPHSEIGGSTGICPSPPLIAACHVLLRLREPRHPPCALVTFRYKVVIDPESLIHDHDSGFSRLFLPCPRAWRSLLWFEFSTLCLLASSIIRLTRFQHVIVLFSASRGGEASVVLGRVELPTSTLSV